MALSAYLDLSSNTGDIFTNSRDNDVMLYTDNNTQNILIGVQRDSNASLTISSNTTIFNGDVAFNNALAIRGLKIMKLDGTTANVTQTSVASFSNDANGVVFYIGGDTVTDSFRFHANNAEKLRLTGTGRLALGTNTPGAALHIANDSFLGAGFPGSTYAGDPGAGQLWLSGSNDTTKRLAFLMDTTSNIGCIQAMKLSVGPYPLCLNAGGGNVGIGTTNPTTLLDVSSATSAFVTIRSTNNVTNANLAFSTLSGSHTIYRNVADNSLRFYNGSADVMSISNNNVGIGTTSPSTTLHVNGSATISSQVLANTADTVSAPSYTWTGDTNTGIYHSATGQVGVTCAGTQTATFSNNALVVGTSASPGYVSAGNLGMFRNRIINGDMRIDQRNNFVSKSLVNNLYPIDRFHVAIGATSGSGTGGTVALTGSDAPALRGFSRALRVSISTAYNLGTNGYFTLKQRIEAYNTYDFGWTGGGNGSPITVSFWFRASVIGNYSFVIRNTRTLGQSYVTSFNVSTGNTWTYYTITVPPPTGTNPDWFNNDNGIGMDIHITGLNPAAINITSTSGWSAPGSAPEVLSTGIVNWIGTVGAYIEFTGVQLEKGPIATPFEFRPYGIELQLCQRYYQYIYGYFKAGFASDGFRDIAVMYPVPMRSTTVFTPDGSHTGLGTGTTATYAFSYTNVGISITLSGYVSAEL